jgi:hypothetical protein
MLKVGDKLYVLNAVLGRILPREVNNITNVNGSSPTVWLEQVPNMRNIPVWALESRLNPSVKEYAAKTIKATEEGNRFQYLFFTEEHLAKKALAEYVLPKRIEELKINAEKLHKDYTDIIFTIGGMESIIENVKKEIDGK